MSFRVEIPVHIKRDRRARKVMAQGDASPVEAAVPPAARLLALAHKWEGMVRRGEVKGYAEIATFTSLTRGRVAQICSLTLLAPDLQEATLRADHSLLPTHDARRVASLGAWPEQRQEWWPRSASV